MKRQHLIPILALSGLAALCWSAFGETTLRNSGADAEDPVTTTVRDKTAAIDRMDAEVNRIASRLGMSAPMEENSLLDGPAIRKKFEEGSIMNVTLEEVEAAIRSAARTPETGDDIDAQVMKHRGSYRFFSPE